MKYKVCTSIGSALVAGLLLVAGCNRNSDTTATGSAPDASGSGSGRGSGSSTVTRRDSGTIDLNDTKANNTGLNKRDRSDAAITPGDQGGSDTDRQITAEIRKSITSNDQLSTEAKNIKIISINGKVTLRGPVKTEQEKQTIADAAQKATGVGAVDNQLEINNANQ